MSSASYWSDKVGEPQELLADRSGIEQLNRTILEKSNEMTDMAAWTETEYDAKMMVDMLVKRAQDDAAFSRNKIHARREHGRLCSSDRAVQGS